MVTTAIAAGESHDAAEAIAAKGLSNAGLLDAKIGPRDLSLTKTRDGVRVGLPIVAAVKGPSGSLDVFGWGSVAVNDAGQIVIDHQADIIEPKDLESAVYDFAKRAGPVDVQHDRQPVGQLIESAFFDPRKRVAMGLDGSGRVGWWAGFRVTDSETIKAVQAGELPEFSIDATAIRDLLPASEVTKSADGGSQQVGRLRQIKLHLLSLVTAGAGKGVTVELWKEKKMSHPTTAEKAMSLDQIVAAIKELPPEDRSRLMDALQPKDPPAPPGADTPAAKALSADLAKAREEAAKAKADTAAVMAEVAKMRDAEETRTAIEKAKTDGLEFLPGDLKDIVKSLRIVRGQDADAAAKLETVLVSAAKAIKSSPLLRSSGAVGTGAVDFEAIYEAEKAKNPNENTADIARRLAKANPELYREYTKRS